MDFKGSHKVLQNFFDLYFFHNETMAPLKFFEISTEILSLYLFEMKERNITTSLLKIYLKYAVVHYANLNSSTINKPDLRAVQYVISFFSISFLFILTSFYQKLYGKTIIF